MNKIDLIINNECVECVDDNKILGEYQLKEKMFIIARISAASAGLSGSGVAGAGNNSNTSRKFDKKLHNSNSVSCLDSSADSSSDECGSGSEDAHNVINSPNVEYENMLPSVVGGLSFAKVLDLEF